MTLLPTPAAWRQGYALYRRRTGYDIFGSEIAVYDLSQPDAVVPAENGISIQRPRAWNPTSGLSSAAAHITFCGEMTGGVLAAYDRSGLSIAPFDRLIANNMLYEVRAVHRWPCHQKLLLQRLD